MHKNAALYRLVHCCQVFKMLCDITIVIPTTFYYVYIYLNKIVILLFIYFITFFN